MDDLMVALTWAAIIVIAGLAWAVLITIAVRIMWIVCEGGGRWQQS